MTLPEMVPADLRIEVVPDRESVFVALHGELDLATAPTVANELRELRALGFARIVLDLRGLAFMDSSGLALIVAQHNTAPAGAFAIVPGDGPPRRLLDLTAVLDSLAVVRERDAPLASPSAR